MPLLLGILSLSSAVSGVSFLIVEVDVDRPPRGFFKGPKWVSLNSVMYEFSHVKPSSCCHLLFVRFHDMISSVERGNGGLDVSKRWFSSTRWTG